MGVDIDIYRYSLPAPLHFSSIKGLAVSIMVFRASYGLYFMSIWGPYDLYWLVLGAS